MILPDYIEPQYCLYNTGANLLKTMMNEPYGIFDMDALYYKFSDESGGEFPYAQYIYSLNWLYLLGLVEITDSGDIKQCF